MALNPVLKEMNHTTMHQDFFTQDLKIADALVYEAIENEYKRQCDQIELIASENIVSRAVLTAQGSVMTNKYAEGYPGRRYYGGCDFVDVVEKIAINRLKQLFKCNFANVQPHSGAQANQAVFLALINPGDTILGLSLSNGGHLTHGSSVNLSGKWFKSIEYGVDPTTHYIDYNALEILAQKHQPKVIIAGGSAYPRFIDFKRFREIADSVNAYLMVDMAHFAGLVAGDVYPSPFPYAHIVTSTTHKTLRGPRGGIILTNDEQLAKKIDSAVFPGLQGGPLMHVIAAKAVAFGEALEPSFKIYAKAVVENTKAMGDVLMAEGLNLISGGTDSHLLLVDLRPFNVFGKDAEQHLETVHITCNKNSIPHDATPAAITSGIRLGAAACTTRGFGIEEFKKVGYLIARTIKAIANGSITQEKKLIKNEALSLLSHFPIYAHN